MRQVVNISLPAAMVKDVQREVKTKQYASTSEFFRTLIRSWQENKIIAELRASQKEMAAGKGKFLRSLKDLH